jgi:hypothetical protein
VENAGLPREPERSQVDLATARRLIEVRGNVSALLEAAGQARDGDRRAAATAMFDEAIREIEPLIRTLPACRALDASRAGVSAGGGLRVREPYRALGTRAAVSAPESARVLEQLHSPRFVDSSPAEVGQRC